MNSMKISRILLPPAAFCAALGAALCGTACAQDASPPALAQVVLHSQAHPGQRQLRLGAVAQVESADAGLRTLLTEVPLLMLPSARQPWQLSRARLQHMLEMRLPALKGRLAYAGADSVLVQPAPPWAVRAGAEVDVRVAQNGVALSDRAHSLDDGEPGQSVRVQSIRSRQQYVAVVLGHGQVEAR
jgi:hypothetical protein